MAKSPKTDKSAKSQEDDKDSVAQDAIEDAVVMDDTETDDSDPSNDDADHAHEPEDAESSPSNAPKDAASDSVEETHSDETGEERERETVVQDAPMPVPVASEGRGGSGAFIGFVLGGVIAGAIGFGAAQYVSGGWPFDMTGSDAEDPVAQALDAQSSDIAALQDQVSSNSEALGALQGDTSLDDLGGQIRADIVATQSRIEELNGRLDDLAGRVSDLEKMPTGDSAEAAEAAAQAYERELAEIREMLDAELAALQAEQEEAQTLEVNAAEAAQAASARAAMSRIMAALDSGQPFEDALFDLTTSTGTEAPEGLASVASEGVPTLGELQSAFPAAAREALDDAIRGMVDAGEIGRGEAFLRTQLGTRSLEPQEGDDPDAILSRAEFALANGRIAETLDELAAMPEAAQPALADFIAAAETRQSALSAGSELSQTLNQ
ncbi:COG4223 family protein [Maritimibacter dapengensis]|uniref:Mitochondrial inner membrane protein n=1 Tax=Maritimibacter dapengensis TaxID=2836868 RepID=A0ABS6T6F5_9RHOB|nr:hypothetical protein [Maritimibacter dapengensis]MBV7379922.1 hypothetical protein [Maritimibacter dapengensis]